MTYIEPPLDTSADSLADDAIAYLEAAIPGWSANPGNLDTLIIEAMAQTAAEQADVAAAATTAVFRYFGPLVNLPPVDGIPASGTVQFTAVDNAGYTVPAGSVVGVNGPDGELIGFILRADVVIAPGATQASGTADADTAGTGGNGYIGAAQLVSTPSVITAATFTAATAGGTDAEDDDDYLDRLAQTLTLLSPRPILPNDFAVLARQVAGVYRAAAVDGLKPSSTSGAIPAPVGAEATGQERTITVAVTDANGAVVGAPIRTTVQQYLDSLREQTFTVYVVDPQYTQIDVTATVQAWPGWDITDVQTRAVAALQAFLSAASWAMDASGDPHTWLNDPTLRQGELYQALAEVDGVRYVTSLTFGIHGGGLGTANVTLGAGSAIPALPVANTLSITVLAG